MPNTPTPSTSDPKQEWQSQQYEEALAHLERLQNQLGSVRSAPQSSIAPLSQRQASEAQLFASLKKTATGTTNALKELREGWQSEQTQDLLARAKQSEARDGDLSKGRDVAKYGWDKEQ